MEFVSICLVFTCVDAVEDPLAKEPVAAALKHRVACVTCRSRRQQASPFGVFDVMSM